MEACAAVEREVDKFMSKLTSFQQSVNKHSLQCSHSLQSCRVNALNEDQSRVLEDVAKMKAAAQAIVNEHKELHASISKIGKAVDKNFIAPDESLMEVDFMQDPQKKQLVHQVLCDYLLRQGQLDTVRNLIIESELPIRAEQMDLFDRVCAVIAALKQKDIQPAWSFVQEFRFQLSSVDSSLEFYLLKLQFTQLINSGKKFEALSLSSNFSKFTNKHTPEIQKLMGALIYSSSNNQQTCITGSLSGKDVYEELIELLTTDLCSMLGLSRSNQSHLATCVEAGCQFLPSLINLKQIMTQGKVGNLWNVKEELPIEINLKLCKYHSLVACPILRQPTTESNPAMRLFCGHIISQEALHKISSSHSKMKCPYCPVEQNAKSALVVNF